MALLTAWIKNGLVAVLALVALAMPAAGGATFSMKRGINLDQWVTWPGEASWGDEGVLFPFPEWRRHVGERELAALKAAGFDFVRMPVDPAPFLSTVSAGSRQRLLGEVLDAVELINAAGLNVVVDIHLIPHGAVEPTGMEGVMAGEAAFAAYLDVVRDLGRALSGRDPAKVAFELMNEPGTECDDAGTAKWSTMLSRLFAAARSSATRHTLVLPGGCGGAAEGLAAVDPGTIPDDNVIWTFHSYQPFLLTHQGAGWAGDFIRYVTGLPYPLDALGKDELARAIETIRQRIRSEAPAARQAGMLAYLDEQVAAIDTREKLAAAMDAPFRTIADWAKANSISPRDIFLGEFGMIRQEYGNPFLMPSEWRAAYGRDMVALAEKHGFAWAIWSYGGAFGIVDGFDGEKAGAEVIGAILPRP